MDQLHLSAKTRNVFGKKNKQLRANGMIPATVYGQQIGPFSIAVDYKEFESIYKQAGDNTVIELNIDNKKTLPVLIQDVVYTPVSEQIVHIDFHAINLAEKVTAYVDIEVVGENDLLKEGGNIVVAMQEVEVEALPTHLPHKIQVDISGIKNFGDTIYVKDLKISKDVKVLADENNPVVTLAAPENIVEELKEMETQTSTAAAASATEPVTSNTEQITDKDNNTLTQDAEHK
jgi:large subunit ribosomal protein L25